MELRGIHAAVVVVPERDVCREVEQGALERVDRVRQGPAADVACPQSERREAQEGQRKGNGATLPCRPEDR